MEGTGHHHVIVDGPAFLKARPAAPDGAADSPASPARCDMAPARTRSTALRGAARRTRAARTARLLNAR